MSFAIDLSAVQLEALASVCEVLAADRWALIGASAIRCRITMPRPTADVDFAVAASGESVRGRLTAAGWTRYPKQLQSWQRAGARIDVIPATDADVIAGVAYLEEGFNLSVIGFDLAFSEVDWISVREGLAVPVPRLPVLALLKMIAWLEQGYERQKDLEDLVSIWDRALEDGDTRRWDPNHAVGAAALDYEDQSCFFVGWELGRIARPEHLHWAKRFVDAMRDDDSTAFAQLVRGSRYVGDNVERRLRARLVAFERGPEIGGNNPAVAIATLATIPPVPSRLFAWGRSGSLEMLLHDAIIARRAVRFVYDGLTRIAEPHVLGTKNGRLQVLTWQTGGASSLRSLPGWRRFFVDELSRVEVLTETFGGPRPAWGPHSSFDRQIAVVRG